MINTFFLETLGSSILKAYAFLSNLGQKAIKAIIYFGSFIIVKFQRHLFFINTFLILWLNP